LRRGGFDLQLDSQDRTRPQALHVRHRGLAQLGGQLCDIARRDLELLPRHRQLRLQIVTGRGGCGRRRRA
jgi:hypothetical protein